MPAPSRRARALLAGPVLLAVVSAPFACTSGGSGAVGDPCTIRDEAHPRFPGMRITEQLVDEGVLECSTGMCLSNHFRGRVSCPLGQPERTPCKGLDDTASCAAGAACVEGFVLTISCTAENAQFACAGIGACDLDSGACACSEGSCPEGLTCDARTKRCTSFVCHAPGDCQSADASDAENAGKGCCVPGTGQPVAEAVCGQCASRPPADTVYCTCRCGEPDGMPLDPTRSYCVCPSGFSCTEIRALGLDDASPGKFCFKDGTDLDEGNRCPTVRGFDAPPICEPE